MTVDLKSIPHRVRLSLMVAAGTGVMLMVLFGMAYRSEVEEGRITAEEMIVPALALAEHECHKRPLNPELFEVTATYPELTLAWFTSTGQLLSKTGTLPLQPLAGTAIKRMGGIETAYSSKEVDDHLLVAGVSMTTRHAAEERLAGNLCELWLLLVLSSGITTWLAAGATFHPLLRLAQRAEQLGRGGLRERLDAQEQGEYAAFADSLNRFLERLEVSVQREEQFVADAAHELRTPLTVVRGNVETTLSQPRTTAEYEVCLRTVLQETNRLSALVEALLLSAAQVEAGVGPISLDEHAERAHARWVDRYAEIGVELSLALSPALASLSPMEFDVILDNLLSNALKASEPNSNCLLTVTSIENLARIEVMDEGPGVPAQARERIFDRFTREDQGRNRNAGGFGVGLAVCKRIVENRHGRIYIAESVKGALFVVEFPAMSLSAKSC